MSPVQALRPPSPRDGEDREGRHDDEDERDREGERIPEDDILEEPPVRQEVVRAEPVEVQVLAGPAHELEVELGQEQHKKAAQSEKREARARRNPRDEPRENAEQRERADLARERRRDDGEGMLRDARAGGRQEKMMGADGNRPRHEEGTEDPEKRPAPPHREPAAVSPSAFSGTSGCRRCPRAGRAR